MELASHGSPLESVTVTHDEGLESVAETRSKIIRNDPKKLLQIEAVGGNSSSPSPPVATKRRGLKKWRRIHVEFGKSENRSSTGFQGELNSVSRENREDDVENDDKHSNKESGTGFRKNEAESEDLAGQNSLDNGNGEKHVHIESMDDVLVTSMMYFHSAHEQLERELQKLKDVGKEDAFFLHDSIQPSQPSNQEEMLKQKIEFEVQFIAISEAIQVEIMVQQKKIASEHVEVMNKVECAESKARELKRQSEKLQVTCQEIMEREEVLKLQDRV